MALRELSVSKMVFDLDFEGISVTEEGKDVRAGTLWESAVRAKGCLGIKGQEGFETQQEARESLSGGSRGTRTVWAGPWLSSVTGVQGVDLATGLRKLHFHPLVSGVPGPLTLDTAGRRGPGVRKATSQWGTRDQRSRLGGWETGRCWAWGCRDTGSEGDHVQGGGWEPDAGSGPFGWTAL